MPICQAKPLRSALLVLALLLALALSACGQDRGPAGTDGPNPAELTPADAPIYAEATIRPEGDLRENLDSVLGKLLDTTDPGAEVVAGLEDAIASDPDYADFSYAEDIEPWLGETSGAFLSDFSGEEGDGALMVATTDPDASEEAIRKLIEAGSEEGPALEEQTYNDSTFQFDPESSSAYGIVGDFLVVGTEDGFKAAVDAEGGSNLAGNGEVTDELDDVREDSVFAALVDIPSLVDILERSGQLPPEGRDQIESQLGGLSSGQVAVSAGADTDALTFDYIAPAASGSSRPPDALGALSADAWLAFATSDVGQSITDNLDAVDAQLRSQSDTGIDSPTDLKGILDQIGLDPERDLGWIGDTSFFVEGSSLFGLGAGLEVEATDTDAASAALDKLKQALDRGPSTQTEPLEGGEGFRVGAEGVPVSAEVELRDDQVAIAVGSVDADAVFDPPESLGDSPEFQDVSGKLDDGLTPTFYLDFKTVASLLESTGQSDPQIDQVLGALDTFVAGSTVDDGKTRGSAVLGVREPPAGGEAALIIP